jgi:hypothetical protein
MLYLFSDCVVNNKVYVGGATNPNQPTKEDCKAICVANPACTYFTWSSNSLVQYTLSTYSSGSKS